MRHLQRFKHLVAALVSRRPRRPSSRDEARQRLLEEIGPKRPRPCPPQPAAEAPRPGAWAYRAVERMEREAAEEARQRL